MADCIIHPIPLYATDGDKSRFTYLRNMGQQLAVVSYSWLIEGLKEKILVDAGGNTEYPVKVRGLKLHQIQSLETGLRKLGVEFGDINMVILTHLHYDHISTGKSFPKARFIVQKEELEYAGNPHPFFATGYHEPFFDGLHFDVVDGDAKIFDEISVIKTPGHSVGGQSVCITTAQGTAIISGLCSVQDNFTPPASVKAPVIVPGMHIHLTQSYDSMLRIKEMADIVVALHEPGFQNVSSIP